MNRNARKLNWGGIGRGLGLSLGLGLLATISVPASAASDDRCAGLAGLDLSPTTRIESATRVAADSASGAPSYCEATTVVRRVPTSRIVVFVRMPENWNGRLLGLGGGGASGMPQAKYAIPGIKAGYATTQTDAGHTDSGPFDSAWSALDGKPNTIALEDFAHIAEHEAAVVGKKVVSDYYGRNIEKTIFQGCSTGGRMAMMESQRYPNDYDGIVGGAPVFDTRTQIAALWRDQSFYQPGASVTKEQLELVQSAALAACDMADGVKDGIIPTPSACHFDPEVLACKGAANDQCLTPPQINAFRRAYSTVRDAKGNIVAFPLARGSETGWSTFVMTSMTGNPLFGNFDKTYGAQGRRAQALFWGYDARIETFDAARDSDKWLAAPYPKTYSANDPDLSPFLKAGGKLLLWHGLNDAGPSAAATTDYYGRAKAVTSAKVGAAAFNDGTMFILAPGVEHCGGGPGAAPQYADLLKAMDDWVTTGRRPTGLVGMNPKSGITRPLCTYPQTAVYTGSGDTAKASSFVCK
jgi:feruloyl esterase